MNVSSVNTTNYEPRTIMQNKPNQTQFQTQTNPIQTQFEAKRRSPRVVGGDPVFPNSQRSADPRMPAPACLRQGSLSGAPITTHEYRAPSTMFGIFTTNTIYSVFCLPSSVPRETFPSPTPHSQTSWQHLYHYKQTPLGHSKRRTAQLLVQGGICTAWLTVVAP